MHPPWPLALLLNFLIKLGNMIVVVVEWRSSSVFGQHNSLQMILPLLLLKIFLLYIDPWKRLGRASRYSRDQWILE
jgi:hypothetical protein